MRKLALLSGMVAVVLGITAAVAFAAATKESLLKNTFGDCTIGALGGTPIEGFAFIDSADDMVLAQVTLKGAPAHARYGVNLVQTPSGESCFGREATLETNRSGYGSIHLAETRLAGTTGAFVILWPANDAAGSTGIIATDGTLLD